VVLFDAKIRKSLFYTLCGSKNGIKTTLLNPIKNKWTALFPDKEYFNLGTDNSITINPKNKIINSSVANNYNTFTLGC
jgi:hypothetical protein